MLQIRKALESDVGAIRALHIASIRTLCAAVYNPEQIAEWTASLTPERYPPMMRQFEFFVAEEEGRIVGFCIVDLATGELNAIYVAPEKARNGVGRSFMNRAEEAIHARGHGEMFVQSTLNAIPFYERCGFRQEGRADHPLPSGRSRICAKMRKPLVAAAASLVGGEEAPALPYFYRPSVGRR